MSDLSNKHCKPCEGGVEPLVSITVNALLDNLNGWKARNDGREIEKVFNFENYYQTMAFVNALAWMAHQENHHPDLEVSYNHCRVRYSTHAIGGISENDFICAAKVEALIAA